MENFINVMKALSDPSRVRALMVLSSRELCACQIIELLKLAPSTVSKHMAVLKQAGLVKSRKDSRWMYYRLADNKNSMIAQVLDFVSNMLMNDPEMRKDNKNISMILADKPEDLCRTRKK